MTQNMIKSMIIKFTFVYFELSSTQNVIHVHVIQNVKINAKFSEHEIYGNTFLS